MLQWYGSKAPVDTTYLEWSWRDPSKDLDCLLPSTMGILGAGYLHKKLCRRDAEVEAIQGYPFFESLSLRVVPVCQSSTWWGHEVEFYPHQTRIRILTPKRGDLEVQHKLRSHPTVLTWPWFVGRDLAVNLDNHGHRSSSVIWYTVFEFSCESPCFLSRPSNCLSPVAYRSGQWGRSRILVSQPSPTAPCS